MIQTSVIRRIRPLLLPWLAAWAWMITALADSEVSLGGGRVYNTPIPGTYGLPIVKSAPDGAIVDSNGSSLKLRELTHGRMTVLSFIYTRCADSRSCPYATSVLCQLHELSREDEVLAKNVRLVSVSFDPENDTPERLAAYAEAVRDEKSGCEWRFATPRSRTDLEKLLNGYGQSVVKRQNPKDPQGPLFHALRVFLIDREGRIRNIYSSGTFDSALILADIRTLLMDEPKVTTQ